MLRLARLLLLIMLISIPMMILWDATPGPSLERYPQAPWPCIPPCPCW